MTKCVEDQTIKLVKENKSVMFKPRAITAHVFLIFRIQEKLAVILHVEKICNADFYPMHLVFDPVTDVSKKRHRKAVKT
jgi:hypothetical protein